MKIVKRPIYKEVMVCENCGHTMPTKNTSYASNSFRFNFKCCVCKEEGCENCTTWFKLENKKYLYHEKCRKNLPKTVLKKLKAYETKEERKAYYHHLEYP